MSLVNIFGVLKGQKQEVGVISSADIISTAVGKFGHANGFTVVASPPANIFLVLLDFELVYDFSVAAYTAGGNITVNYTGGSAITGLISAANSVGAATDKFVSLVPLATAGINVSLATGISLVSSAAFTNPGTAAGIIRYTCTYRTVLGL